MVGITNRLEIVEVFNDLTKGFEPIDLENLVRKYPADATTIRLRGEGGITHIGKYRCCRDAANKLHVWVISSSYCN